MSSRRQPSRSETASSPNALAVDAIRRNPCCVKRQKKRLSRISIEGCFGHCVMDVDLKRQRKPEINVGKKHPALLTIRRLVQRSVGVCQDAWNEPMETRPASVSRCQRSSQVYRKRLPPCLRATSHPVRERLPRPGLDPLSSYHHSRLTTSHHASRNSYLTEGEGCILAVPAMQTLQKG